MKQVATLLVAALSVFLTTRAHAQNYFPLSPGSKYACLIGGSKNFVVIPNSKGYKLTTFPAAAADIKDNIKSTVLRRATLRSIKANLQKQKSLSRKNSKALEKLAKKLGFPLADPGSAFDEQIHALEGGLETVDGKIKILNFQLQALDDCKKNRLKKTEQAQRTIGYFDGNFFGPAIIGYALYTAPDFGSKEDRIVWCVQSTDGTFNQITLVTNPCGGFGDCSKKGYRGYVLTYKVGNYTDRQGAIDRATSQLLSTTPEAYTLVSLPKSGLCSDYNP